VVIHAVRKLLLSFSDVLKATNCTFQEVDNIFCLAIGIAVYDDFFSCMCAAELLCALDVFARHTSSHNASINHCFNKASGIGRKDLIQYKEKNANNHNTIFTGGVSIQKGDIFSRCFMGECYSGVNIVGMVKETIEVFFRLGPLHVNVVYETKPGKWLVRCRLYDMFTPL
jgi:hypothetical protein